MWRSSRYARPAGRRPGPPAGRAAEPVQDDEAQHRAAGLLVDPHRREQVGPAGRRRTSWAGPAGQDVRCRATAAASSRPTRGQLGGVDQTDRDGLAVPPPVALGPLHGVAERVPVVEDLAQAGLAQVLRHDVGLHPHRALDQLTQHAAAGSSARLGVRLDQLQDPRVGHEARS